MKWMSQMHPQAGPQGCPLSWQILACPAISNNWMQFVQIHGSMWMYVAGSLRYLGIGYVFYWSCWWWWPWFSEARAGADASYAGTGASKSWMWSLRWLKFEIVAENRQEKSEKCNRTTMEHMKNDERYTGFGWFLPRASRICGFGWIWCVEAQDGADPDYVKAREYANFHGSKRWFGQCSGFEQLQWFQCLWLQQLRWLQCKWASWLQLEARWFGVQPGAHAQSR